MDTIDRFVAKLCYLKDRHPIHRLWREPSERLSISPPKIVYDCQSCGKPGRWKKCGLCRSTHYCSVRCQTDDWSKHQLMCKEYRQEDMPYYRRLINRASDRLVRIGLVDQTLKQLDEECLIVDIDRSLAEQIVSTPAENKLSLTILFYSATLTIYSRNERPDLPSGHRQMIIRLQCSTGYLSSSYLNKLDVKRLVNE